jgi:para-nitrobenzyl esterase
MCHLFALTGAASASAAVIMAAVMAVALPPSSARAEDAAPIVTTAEGQLQGVPSRGVLSFLGIHYGADTGGANRFLPPAPPPSWGGVRVADRMGDRCPQPPVNMPPEMASVLSFSDLPTSEDCLVLNVWTPAVTDNAKRPVMVWLHGGGFFLGSGGDKYYEGSNLSRGQDVVVVTLNHRLNVFGYLQLGSEAGPEYADSNLAGMLDIVAALKWVKANIAQFGGDPDNVTIFGQSGGGSKVSTLLAMPAAQGLFAKAIIESGAAVKVGTVEAATATRDKLYAQLGLQVGDVASLRALPTDTLMKAGARAGLLAYLPAVDGETLPTNPFDPVGSPLSATVPIMVGSTKDEATNVVLSDPTWQTMTEADLLTRVGGMVGPQEAASTIALYRAQAPTDQPMHLYTSIMTDMMFTSSSITLAERKYAQHSAPVYMYKIDWNSPVLGGKLRSPHAVELPFIFDNVDVSAGLVGAGPGQDTMAHLMSATFAAFARTGNPSIPGAPAWPAYTPETRETFIYDVHPTVVADPNSQLRTYWADRAAQPQPGESPIQSVMDGKKFQ